MAKEMNLILILGLIIMASLNAAEPAQIVKLSLNDAINLALKESDDLKLSQITEEQAEKEYKIVRSVMMPKISVNGGYSSYFNRSEIPTAVPGPGGSAVFTNLPMKRKYGMDAGISVSQILFSFGQIYHGVKAAKEGIGIEKLQRENQKNDVVFQISNSYWATVLAKKSWEISESSYQNIRRNRAILIKRYSNGRVPQADLVKMDRDLSLRRPEVLRAQNEYKMSLAIFKYLLNLSQNTVVGLEDELEFSQLQVGEQNYSKKVAGTTTVKILQQKLKIDDHLIKKERASFLPTVSAFANYSTFGSSEESNFPGQYDKNHYGVVGVQITIPLFEGFRKTNSYQKAILARTKTITNLSKAKRWLSLELRNSYSEYQTNLSVYEENLKTSNLAQRTFGNYSA